MRFQSGFLFLCLFVSSGLAAERVIDAEMHHLRGGGDTREWLDMPAEPEGDSLTVSFEAKEPNAGTATLWLRQRNVQWRWILMLNEKQLGTLREDEQGARLAWPIPPNTLKAGVNTITITHKSGQRPDDIWVGDLRIDSRPPFQVLGEREVEIVVKEAGKPEADLPCRITVSDAQGDLVMTGNGTTKTTAVRPGVVYTLDGRVVVGLPSLGTNELTVTASRGFEYGINQKTLGSGDWPDSLAFELEHQVRFPGRAIDPHIHTLTHSRHGSCRLHERIITMRGEGLHVGASTEHNLNIDWSDMAAQLGVKQGREFSTVVGNEYTTRTGHFNLLGVDPEAKPPGYIGNSWAGAIAGCKASGAAVVILNHARDEHLAFRPFDPKNHEAERGQRLDGGSYDFLHGMEVVNSGATQTDPFELTRDWLAMRKAGWNIGAIGSSDSHDVSRYIVGQARTYFKDAPDADRNERSAAFDLDRFATELASGQTHLSYGLLVELEWRDGTPKVTVHKPDWITHEKTTLYRNGEAFDPKENDGEIKPGDWLVAVAEGPGVTAPHWPFARPYKPDGPLFKPRAIGISNIVRVRAE